MRILYGVVGEGMGHATRSRVVIEHLLGAGHEVDIVVSGRAHDLLREAFGGEGGADVRRIHGLHMVYADNEVQKRLTLLGNLEALRTGLPTNVKAWSDAMERWEPDVVISDFESLSYLYARLHRIPVVSIDNMQVINRAWHPDELIAAHKRSFLLSKAIVKTKLPGCDHYFITSFFFPETRKERTTLVPPILRPVVLEAAKKARRGDHVVVYQSGESHDALVDVMRGFSDTEFRVYGLRRDITETERDGNLVFRPFSETGFIDDVATSRAAIAGGGFSLMGECVFLHKPLLSVPLSGQFEQILNAGWLQHLGYGLHRQHIEAADVAELLERAPEFAENLAAHRQDGNRMLLGALDAKLAEIEAR